MAAPSLIPVIDLAPYFAVDASSEAKEQIVTAICDASRTYGFFSVIGHGIPIEDQDTTLECAKQFFDLPFEEKMSVFIEDALGTSNRGYELYKGQTLQPGTLPDMKEVRDKLRFILDLRANMWQGFVIGAEVPRDDPDAGTFLTGPNQWPQSLTAEEFEKPVMEYRNKLVELSEKVLRILALGLPKAWNCSPDVFDDFFINASGNLRLLHYPPQLSPNPQQFGGKRYFIVTERSKTADYGPVGAHTDFGGLTFLLQQPGSKGLEVWYPPTECWVPVPVTPDSYVVNIGDLVEKWTAGYYRSAVHRVINSGENHRYSAPFFLNGNMKLKIQPLNGSGQEFGVRDHFMYRLKSSLGIEKSKFLEKDTPISAVIA
jgi:isopenicillin N synthase-like dioxygenase